MEQVRPRRRITHDRGYLHRGTQERRYANVNTPADLAWARTVVASAGIQGREAAELAGRRR